jgi:hypothetical protein
MAETEYYKPILFALTERLNSVASGNFYLEVTATEGITQEIKKAIPAGREIAFSFMNDRPDIAGWIGHQFAKHLLVAEVKETSPTLRDIYQVKRYKEVLDARYAFLFAVGPIEEELKRLCAQTPNILMSAGDAAYSFLAIAQFWPGTREFIDWFPANPFEKEFYWK